MPRIRHSLLLQAYRISPLLPLTLRATRDFQSAKNELRWLIEHVQETVKARSPADYLRQTKVLLKLCKRREKGEPLQYILGSQPFGDLDIKCRPGVLIPRPETENYTTYLAKLLQERRLPGIQYDLHAKSNKDCEGLRPLDVLDICSGSGCISILLHSKLCTDFNLTTTGWDISQKAIDLSMKNMERNKDSLFPVPELPRRMSFDRVDIFEPPPTPKRYDVVISNPPYLSTRDYNKRTSRSVRNWEPKLALIPPLIYAETRENERARSFFRRILELDRDTFKSKILIMEVSGGAQAFIVATLVYKILGRRLVEIWSDVPGSYYRKQYVQIPDARQTEFTGKQMCITKWGKGKSRTVVVYGSDVPCPEEGLGDRPKEGNLPGHMAQHASKSDRWAPSKEP